MIRLTKYPKPQILADNEVSWTRTLLGFVKNGHTIPANIQSRYRDIDIKNCLKLETANKCVYCESYITHIYYGDVEHIIPKSIHPELTFNWENLTFVCAWCNNNKRDYYDSSFPLLNPYIDSIDDHVRLYGGLIFHINDSKRGEITHKVIKLNRPELVERRNEALQVLQTLIDKYNRETIPSLKDILKQEILEQINPKKEYSNLKRQFLVDVGLL